MRPARETGRAARSKLRSEQETASSTLTKLVVAAIDFGTTYSGYAYSFLSDFKKDPLTIYANTKWNSGGGEGLVTDKTPTTILFKPNGDFHSFGYEAEDQYAELAEDDKHEDWYYFSRFKMTLHGQTKIRREMELMDDQGHQMPAMKVFSEAIKYLKTHMWQSLCEKIPDIKDTDIHWVITVPAIWDDGAKQFMREAGKEAGIPNNQLDLALEPEAAAIYCKAISVKRDGSFLEPETQFILVDLGGTLMSKLFEDVKMKIIQHMQEMLMQHPEVNIVLMVGGFSESKVIKMAVKEAFPDKTVIIPEEARLAVVKGAVMYGHNNSVIISRSMPFTYGISVAVLFDANKHPESKKMYEDGYYKCKDNFMVFIRAGDTVTPGKTTIQHVCKSSTVSSANVVIYRTRSKYPIYIDEPGCAKIGKIKFKLNNTSAEITPIQITMSFGSTELSVQAKEQGTNNAVVANFNFLH